MQTRQTKAQVFITMVKAIQIELDKFHAPENLQDYLQDA